MSTYWDPLFVKHLDPETIEIVMEVGARYGDESKQLKKVFPKSQIHTFECNPNTIERCRSNLSGTDIIFNDYGLGSTEERLPFYSYHESNDGASSFLKRIDFDRTQKENGFIQIRRLEDYAKNAKIEKIDLLCMDVQGYELNVLKGAGDYLRKIGHIIMEEPKPVINPYYLPKGVHSKYLNAPTSQEIRAFMKKNGFEELERVEENKIEDNVMYRNIKMV